MGSGSPRRHAAQTPHEHISADQSIYAPPCGIFQDKSQVLLAPRAKRLRLKWVTRRVQRMHMENSLTPQSHQHRWPRTRLESCAAMVAACTGNVARCDEQWGCHQPHWQGKISEAADPSLRLMSATTSPCGTIIALDSSDL
jgi:hypothetical protein